MEKAIYITKLCELPQEKENNDFSRIYFGNEFCERLLPTSEELRAVIDFATERKMEFTLVTPYVTNKGLERLEKLLSLLAKETSAEVVFNDYGVLRLLLRKFGGLEPVMGRLLNKMKRGPRLMNLIGMLPETSLAYFRGSSIEVSAFRNFLSKNGINRVELDNLLQGISLNLPKFGFSASLYIPYGYITTTRNCLAIDCDVHGKEDVVGIFPCKKECQRYTFYLKSKAMPITLIRKGNTIFFKNETIPKNLDEIGIDRIVYEPNLPL
jgi:hypothetical protein